MATYIDGMEGGKHNSDDCEAPSKPIIKDKINRSNIAEHLIKYQLAMVGKTMEEALLDDMWFFNWKITQEKYDEFKRYAILLIKKVFKCNKQRAEKTFEWFDLEFGLSVLDK